MGRVNSGKRILFSVVLVLLGWLFLEALALVLHRAWNGVALEREAAREQIASLARGTASANDEAPANDLFRGLALHPYVGFSEDLSGTERANQPLLGWSREELSRADDRLVVGIFGGSLAWWMCRDAGEFLAQALEEATGKPIALRNFAFGGIKQPQQLMILTYLLSMGAEFDYVINLDGFNEIVLPVAENRVHGVFSNYPRSWLVLAGGIDSPDSLRLMARIEHLRTSRGDWARRIAASGLDFSSITLLLWRARDVDFETRIRKLEQELALTSTAALDYRLTGPSNTAIDEDDFFRTLAGWWRDSSLQMHRLSEANGIHYLHFLQPNQYVDGSKPMSQEERAIAIDASHPYSEGARSGYPFLIEAGGALRSQGVSFADLTAVFRDEPRPRYIDSCCHLNAAGSRTIAREIAVRVASELRKQDATRDGASSSGSWPRSRVALWREHRVRDAGALPFRSRFSSLPSLVRGSTEARTKLR